MDRTTFMNKYWRYYLLLEKKFTDTCDRLPKFMEEQITSADYVLIICTPTYKRKADKRTGGVGYEGHIISGELMNLSNERKFIPVKRKGTFENAIPTFLRQQST